jgi:hypothetical protein
MPEQQTQQKPTQPLGLEANATLRTKAGLPVPTVKFNNTNCKFLVLKSVYNSTVNPRQDCYLTANFTGYGENRPIIVHLFDALNAQDWKIDNWSKVVKTGLNLNKTRKPTDDEKALIKSLSSALAKEKGLALFFANPNIVEASYSENNPRIGTNSANKQNQIDNGIGSKQKQPSAAVQGAIEGMSEKNPALESITNKVFDRIIRESHDAFDILMDQAYESGYNYASDTIEDDDDILCKDEEMRPIFNDIFEEDNDMLFNSWKDGYKKYVCRFLEIDHAVDYDSDYIHESVESDKEEFINYINNIFDDTRHMEVGKCPDCGMILTDEDELEDGTHECPKCGSILEDNDTTDDFWDKPDDEPEF